MIDQEERIKGVVKGFLKEQSLNEPVGWAVGIGFGPVPLQDASGQQQMYMGPYWTVLVTLRNPIVGGEDIASGGTLPGPLPNVLGLQKIITTGLNECRAKKDAILRGEQV